MLNFRLQTDLATVEQTQISYIAIDQHLTQMSDNVIAHGGTKTRRVSCDSRDIRRSLPSNIGSHNLNPTAPAEYTEVVIYFGDLTHTLGAQFVHVLEIRLHLEGLGL
jgi:hypothetical protein